MRKRNSLFAMTFAVGASLVSAHSASAVLVVYEPFADNNASLTGNTSGTGLTGNWTATAAWDVLPGSMSWGSLPTSGNRVRTDSGGAASVALSSDLADAGLLNDGATLWFSMIYTTTPAIGTNPDAAFAIGTDTLGGSNNIPMSNSGSGAGFSIKNGNIHATTWASGSLGRANPVTAASAEPVTGGTTYLVVGEFIWNANPAGADTINLYLPDTDLALGTVKATRSVVLNQTLFDLLAYGQKNDSNPAFFDEIRFGSTYDDVIGVQAAAVPEPATAALGLMGLAGLMMRRRRMA